MDKNITPKYFGMLDANQDQQLYSLSFKMMKKAEKRVKYFWGGAFLFYIFSLIPFSNLSREVQFFLASCLIAGESVALFGYLIDRTWAWKTGHAFSERWL
ncbi:MAG: hypothetical protein HN975_08655 [Anaerolineae bacterium]|jgi:hypothetical protein|nr:hypothetical protein [Anaerolineae bacterium]